MTAYAKFAASMGRLGTLRPLARLLLPLIFCFAAAAQAQQQTTLYFSTLGNNAVPGVASPYDDSDIYTHNGVVYGKAFDAVSNLGLPSGASVDALSVVGNTLYLSFSNTTVTIPGLGAVPDENVVRYQGGVWSTYFQGSRCGLSIDNNGDVDAIAVVGNVLYFSTVGNTNVSGLGAADDADVYSWVENATSCGRVMDATARGLPASADVDALEVIDSSFYLSFLDAAVVPGGLGTITDEAVVRFDSSGPTWSLYFSAPGLDQADGQDLDALSIVQMAPPPPAPVLALDAPLNGSTVIGTSVSVAFRITGDAAQATYAQLRLDGGSALTVPVATGVLEISGVSPGVHVLTGHLARADQTKIAGSDAISISFTVVAPPVSPRLVISGPTAGSTLVGTVVDVAFTTTGDLSQASHVHLALDGGPEMMVMSLSGTLQLTDIAPGSHTLTGYVARQDHTKIEGSDAVAVAFTTTLVAPPPKLTISSPTSGGQAIGPNVAVTFGTNGAQADANHAHFRLDGGPDIMVMALAGTFEIAGVTAGTHTLDGYLVRADHSKITGSDATSISFNVTIPAANDPVLVGQWSSQLSLPTVAVNLSLLHTGKAIFWAGDFSSAPNYGELWDPATNLITPAPNPYSNIFCSAHVHLADGSLLVAGGHDAQNGILGIADSNTFNPVTESWLPKPDMAFRRWYPTLTLLGDGRAIVVSGSENSESQFVETPEIYDPVTSTWTQLGNARLSVPQYPMNFLLADGRLLQTGSTEQPTATRALSIPAQQWSVIDSRILDGGSSVMYAPGKIMKSGSSSNDGQTPTALSAATTYVLDMNVASPSWRQTTSMQYPRTFHNLTSLADGTVLVTSGSRRKSETNLGEGVLQAELWSPENETWTTLAPMQNARIYHSTAVLLPDGRVAVSGSGNIAGGTDQLNLEIFSPPYLFKGARPVISTAPSLVKYGSSFVVETPDASRIRAVNLIRPGAATHSFDQDQRFVPVSFTQAAGGLQISVPSNTNLLPPGYYMLFLVNDAGVPSVARFVRLPAGYEDSEPPTAPGGATGTGSVATATISWTASTDNVGVVRYEIHRSLVPGFAPSPATLIGQSTTTSFTDLGVPAGTYYYVVVAVDPAGTLSSASTQVAVIVAADSAPPVVSVSAPIAGSTLSGNVTVTATATDNVSVAGVQFRLNGALLGSEDTVAPYSYVWNSATATNGAHVLTAVARDASNNTMESLAVNVIVSNTAQVPAGLVAAYGFEEGTGTTLGDASGRGHAGTISGATWTTAGKYGKALSFDGVNDLVTIADTVALDLTTGMTLEAWVYPTALTGWRTVMMKEVSGELAYTLYANEDVQTAASYVRIGTSSRRVAGGGALPLNAWTHLAPTYDGSTLRLYVNGVQVGSQAMTGSIAVSALPLRIGGNSVWGEYFGGRIDEVRIYNRALSAGEILSNVNLPVIPPPASQPTRSSSISVASQARKVWVVNPDTDTVTALNADTLVVQMEIPVGRHPTSVALDNLGQVWITCRDDDTVWVLDSATGAVRNIIAGRWGSAPVSVVFTPDGSKGFIAFQGTGTIQQATPAGQVLGTSISVGPVPHALAVSADARRLLVSQLISTGTTGAVRPVDIASFAAGAPVALPIDSTSIDGSLAARGLPNYLAGLAIDPANGVAWVVGKKDNVLRGQLRDGQPLTFETTVRALVSRLDLNLGQEQLNRRIDLDNASQPSAVALSESGALAFITLQGTNRLIALNQLGVEIARGDTGLAPQGLAIDPVTQRIYTQDLMSRTVSVFDGARLLNQGLPELPRLAQVATIGTEKFAPAILRGKQIFYNAADTRMGRDGYLSCASCHLDGADDGRTWDFTDRGEGLRNTISLRGRGGASSAPLHWSGNFDEVQDFENDIRAFFGGTGFMNDTDFAAGTRAQPLGDAKAGLSVDLDALAAYLGSLTDSGRSPHRQASGATTAGGVSGKVLFDANGCQSCHSGPRFSDSSTGARHDVGTIKPSSGARAGAPLDGLDTPTLLGLWTGGPYLHDGSAPTVRDVLTTANPAARHGNLGSLAPAEIDLMVEYLMQLESPP